MDDWKQLAAYAENGDEAAFTTLVSRHIGVVYGAALRQLGDPAAAEEVSQEVFLTLARRAHTIKPRGSLASWLYSTACHKAIDLYRSEVARKRRERNHAKTMEDENSNIDSAAIWSDVAPSLDEAMRSLRETDRAAILMRYFEERPIREVSETLGISENAARKRIGKAMERLRSWFNKRGITCTTGAMSVSIGAYAAKAVPETLTHSAVQSVMAQGAISSMGGPSTTILTTITAMKLPLVTGLLIGGALPLSLAYLNTPTSPPPTSFSPHRPPNHKFVELEVSGLMAEFNEMRALYGPDSGSMPAFYEAIQQIDDSFRRRVFRSALVAEWASLDPEGALTYFQSQNKRALIKNFLSIWLEADPTAAIAAMEKNGEVWGHSIGSLLGAVATIKPYELARLAPFVKSNNPNDGRIQEVFATAARRNLSEIRKIAEDMNGKARQEALAGVAESWAETDGDAALAWAQALEPSDDCSHALRGLLVGWAKSDPTAALDRLYLAPPGGTDKSTAEHPALLLTNSVRTAEMVIRSAAKTDFEATLDWMVNHSHQITIDHSVYGLSEPLGERLYADLPGTLAMITNHKAQNFLKHSLESILRNEGRAYNDGVWEWLNQQEQSPLTTELKKSVLGNIAYLNPDRALALAEQLVLQNDMDAVNFPFLSHQFNQDIGQFQRVESLLRHAPDEVYDAALRHSLSNTPIDSIGQESWLNWLEQLPPKDRGYTVATAASHYARSDPAAAEAWANSMTGRDRSNAYKGIAQTWAEADSYEASKWIATLPRGAERDHAVQALAQSVADTEPDSAWAWAQTIEESGIRESTLQTVLREFSDVAFDILELSSLGEEEKGRLRVWLASQEDISRQQNP